MATEEELVKTILNGVELPKSIQGDGRYVMTLLNKYLAEMAIQVNLANGFTAEEITSDSSFSAPKDFYLQFTRTGGKLTWTHIADVANLAYYELRTNTWLGDPTGLLDRTTSNESTSLPENYVGTIYLYAVKSDGTASNASVLNYTKARPDAPTDIAVNNTQGTMIVSFSEIPSNCIGANVYVDGTLYTTTENSVYIADGTGAKEIRVAYYDQFGEGEQGYLYLVLPDITGFLVERNGAELDFYWDALNIYGVKYLVKVGTEPNWEQATELFRTATNDKNRRLYPNEGVYYLMVKAYDLNGNYSENAAVQIMNTEPDISRNVILEFDQEDTLYSGTKINTYYNPAISGVTLARENSAGEYIFGVNLDQKYRARNWLDCKFFALDADDFAVNLFEDMELDFDSYADMAFESNSNGTVWADMQVMWDAAQQPWAGLTGDIDSDIFRQEIALEESDSGDVFLVKLEADLLTEDETEPTVAQNADTFMAGRWGNGLKIEDLTLLEYPLNIQTTAFTMTFFLKTQEYLTDMSIVTIKGDDGWLRLGYDATREVFYLIGSDNKEITIPYTSNTNTEYFAFSISQGRLGQGRALFVNIYTSGATKYAIDDTAEPLGKMDTLYAYPKLIV